MRRQPLRREELMMSNHKPSDLQTYITEAGPQERNSKKQHCRKATGSALQHLDKPCSPCPAVGAAGEVRAMIGASLQMTGEASFSVKMAHFQQGFSLR